MTHREHRKGWLVRTALVAAITFSLAMAVAGGIMFGHSVTSPGDTVPERTTERPPPAAKVAEKERPEPEPWPARGAAAKAERIAESRSGVISFAAIGPAGKTVGHEPGRRFYSASVSKAMLLVAELRRLRREGAPLDEATRSTLERMITLSDNDAADAIYARVGDAGLDEVAKVAGMTGFAGGVGHWSNVQLTAGDMALFMSKLDGLLDLPGGGAGSEMLASVIPTQSWGVPKVVSDRAAVRFKGGWRPTETGELVHQAARVDVGGESYSVAILTDGNPSMPYGEETIRLIAAELLRGSSSRPGGPGS